MNGRTIALILVFWAILTIVTPILVHMSESAKQLESAFHDATGEIYEEIRTRKMMEDLKIYPRKTSVNAIVDAPSPAPAVEPIPIQEPKRLIQTKATTLQ